MSTRPTTAGAALGAVALLAALLIPSAAMAADGPPPTSTQYWVLDKVHTDAVSTFLAGDTLELGTKADVREGNGTRLDPRTTLFHLDDAAATRVPAGYEFVAPAGSEVWIAPESNPMGTDGYTVLWPGFSTESVAPGALLGDRTTFTLEGLAGPGDLEVYTGGGAREPNRLWSSDEGISSFTIGHTHMHANWAFTAPGEYTLDVLAEATTTAGAPVSARNSYTFVVGELAPATATTTALTVGAASVVQGQAVTLEASVTPADATGWVEFLDGGTTLGHAELRDGGASIEVSTLRLGERSLSARFVPAVVNDFEPSVSGPRSVTVVEEDAGEQFGIAGWQDTFVAGDVIELGARGVTLEEGQQLRWLTRLDAGDTEYITGAQDTWVRDATTLLSGVQLALVVWDPAATGEARYVQQTPWHTFTVTGENVGSGEPLTVHGMEGSYYLGDRVEVTVEHAPLEEGQSYRLVQRVLPYSSDFYPAWVDIEVEGDRLVIPTAALDSTYASRQAVEAAVQIIDEDENVIAQSAAFAPTIMARTLELTGVQDVYRVGQTITISGALEPAREDVTYQWSIGTSSWEAEAIEGATSIDLTLPVTADLMGMTLFLSATDVTSGHLVASPQVKLRVVDAAEGEQVVLIDGLGEHGNHYHQGSPVAFSAIADPVASDTDSFVWEWKRVDWDEWRVIEGFTTANHQVTAEQALDGTEVRVSLVDERGEVLGRSAVSTILVDDHGAPPHQRVTVTGLEHSYTAGEKITVTADVAPASVLTRWEWHVTRGDHTHRLVETTDPTVSFTASEDMDGEQLVARLTFDDGTQYVESAPLALSVTAATEPDPTEPDPVVPTDPGPTDPEPVDPAPTEPAPADPAPTQPAPADPGLSEPGPDHREPSRGPEAPRGEAGAGGLARTGLAATPLLASAALVALGGILTTRRRRHDA